MKNNPFAKINRYDNDLAFHFFGKNYSKGQAAQIAAHREFFERKKNLALIKIGDIINNLECKCKSRICGRCRAMNLINKQIN